MKRVLLSIFIGLFVSALFIQGQGDEQMRYSNYDKVRKKIDRLCRQKKYDQACRILEQAKKQIPGKLYEITFELARLYITVGKYEESLETFEYGLQQNIIYPIWPDWDFWNPLREYERFGKILARNSQLQREATARTGPRFEAVLPEGYRAEKKYPLFIVLHGWNGSIADVKKFWKSAALDREYLLAFVQSSQVVDMRSFGWDDTRLGRQDIERMYGKIIEDYAVAEDRVIMGGFSQGGLMALDAAVNHVIPAAGFVVFEPGGKIPAELNGETVKKAAARGLRGTLMFGQDELTRKEQQEIVQVFDAARLNYRRITTNSGHWYPRDFGQYLDDALKVYISNR